MKNKKMFEEEICAILNNDLYHILILFIGIIWILNVLYRIFQYDYELSAFDRIERKNLTGTQRSKKEELDIDTRWCTFLLSITIGMFLYIKYGCYLRGLEEKLWEHLDLLEKVWEAPNDWKKYSLTKECT